MTRLVARPLLWLSLLMACAAAHAETVSFDRPGIAFSTATLASGTFAIEQGLPDVVHDSGGGEQATLYSAGTVLRVGLTPATEIQLGTALFNRLETDTSAGKSSTNGYGDSSVALKARLPSASDSFSWAVLGGIGLDTGEDAFTAGATQYSLGLTGSWDLSDTLAFVLYTNADRLHGENIWTFSPSLSFSLNDRLSAYVQAGASFVDGSEDYLAGAGLAWMLTPRVQLDLYADGGLTADSTDLMAGFGVSVYFD